MEKTDRGPLRVSAWRSEALAVVALKISMVWPFGSIFVSDRLFVFMQHLLPKLALTT